MDEFRVESRSVADTHRLGQALGEVAQPGLVVALVGQLGAGKTTFTRAVAQGLGLANPREVTSPTFVLIQEYPARIPVYHFDTYRLNDAGEFLDLGAEEYFADDGVCMIEWADRVAHVLPDDRLEITFEAHDGECRTIFCKCYGQRWSETFQAWWHRWSASTELDN